MEFKQAIKQIVQEQGVKVLSERRVISILLDIHAFENMSYAKKMLTQIYQEGYGERIYKAYVAKDITQVNAIKKSIVDTYGFDNEKVTKIFSGFNNAVGIKEPIKVTLKPKAKTEPEKQPTARTTQTTRTAPPTQTTRTTQTKQAPKYDDDLQTVINAWAKPTPTANTSAQYYCAKIEHFKCDEYSNIIGHSYDKLYVNDVKFLVLDIDLVCKSSNIRDYIVEIRVKTANGVSDVRKYKVWLNPGSNKITTHNFGNYDGNYYGEGTTTFDVYVNNQFVCQHSVEINPPVTLKTAVKNDTEWKVCFSIIILGLNIGLWFDIGWWTIIPIIFGIWTLVKLWKDELLNKYKIQFLIAYLVCSIALLLPLNWWITTLVIIGCVTVLALLDDKLSN